MDSGIYASYGGGNTEMRVVFIWIWSGGNNDIPLHTNNLVEEEKIVEKRGHFLRQIFNSRIGKEKRKCVRSALRNGRCMRSAWRLRPRARAFLHDSTGESSLGLPEKKRVRDGSERGVRLYMLHPPPSPLPGLA